MNLTVSRYPADQAAKWDAFISRSNEGTVFHRFSFLAYHEERFREQEHNLIWHNEQQAHAVMPMAIVEEDGVRTARSPYGASYGGPVTEKALTYNESRELVSSLLAYLTSLSVARCLITLPLSCYYERYSETFRLVLIEHGFNCVNRDISSVVSLDSSSDVLDLMRPRARRHARQAAKNGVTFKHGAPIEDFWQVLEKTFQKHGSPPTHTFQEFQWLIEHLSEDIHMDVAYLQGQPVAGIGRFVINRRVTSSFYICSDPEFQDSQALSGLICEVLKQAQANGFKWFDFGTSSDKMKGRENIFSFKEGFGAIGLFRDTYLWNGVLT